MYVSNGWACVWYLSPCHVQALRDHFAEREERRAARLNAASNTSSRLPTLTPRRSLTHADSGGGALATSTSGSAAIGRLPQQLCLRLSLPAIPATTGDRDPPPSPPPSHAHTHQGAKDEGVALSRRTGEGRSSDTATQAAVHRPHVSFNNLTREEEGSTEGVSVHIYCTTGQAA